MEQIVRKVSVKRWSISVTMINICIVSVKRLPGTESPEGEVKLKNAECSFLQEKIFSQSISPQSSITTFLLVFPEREPKPSICDQDQGWARSNNGDVNFSFNIFHESESVNICTFLTTSMPSTILPKTTCLPSSHSVLTDRDGMIKSHVY